MEFSTIKNKQPYLFEVSQDSAGEDFSFVEAILEACNLDKPSRVEFVACNYDYDVFKALINRRWYCIKFSFDTTNYKLKNEFECLKNSNAQFCPKAIRHDKIKFGDEVEYLVLSFEDFENLDDYGFGLLAANKDVFLRNYFESQKQTSPQRSFHEYINSFLRSISLDALGDDAVNSISDHSDIEKIKSTMQSIESELLALCTPEIIKKQDHCHGSLKPSNILSNFNLIDFNEGYIGNDFMDLCCLMIHIGADLQTQKEWFNLFVMNKESSDVESLWKEYQHCYQIVLRKTFLEILSLYLREVYLFSSERPIKILRIINLFIKNQKTFFSIPSINKHYEFIYKSILEPVIDKE